MEHRRTPNTQNEQDKDVQRSRDNVQDQPVPESKEASEEQLAHPDEEIFEHDEDEVFCEEHTHVVQAWIVQRDKIQLLPERQDA